MSGREDAWGFETRAVHVGQEPDETTGAITVPIHLATTFVQAAPGQHRGYEYSRTSNPTRAALERSVAGLEGARHGFAFASGMAAEDALVGLLRPGDHVVLGLDAYGGTFRLIARVYGERGIEWSAVDLTDPAALTGALRPETRQVWVETPTNPMLAVVDIAAVASTARAAGAAVIVDNTFATPYLQNPLALGADVVVHSSTKYLGGHSDVVGGFIAVDHDQLAEQMAFVQNAAGAVPSPFDCYLLLRGVKTLGVRMDRHCSNAQAVAEYLTNHPRVARVLYPGLPDHPGHDLAARQMRCFGGMVSCILAGGEDAAVDMVSSTRVFRLAESLGAVESLIEQPSTMTHLSVADSPLAVDPGLIRLSVGIETIDDLLADLDQALA
ncbi:MAG: cystathionine gamma-synthase [Acidimicrobiaceae bacterium]|nr:cystathionine gamma-synthase [Acidimicrobiaceae bacterium]MXZ98631.1 cystathionine gamma-synthase [Acidimicrobiaceae bacterium]MYE76574.1 cystathionine gamma-synthase [Acidimicrobiaceae bacterium]MYE98279.1 cystathionine gamma-synthase [Acidimicrobiaceae bacterium]MYI53083.1 cystathionine gamma-synthase [Acidimicrobiaceae bacterium]